MSHGPSSTFHFAAGLSTGVLSAALLQPADLLKTRIQQSKHSSLLSSLREIRSGPSPWRQLWRGTLPSIIRTGLGSALYFSSLNALRQRVARSQILQLDGKIASNSTSSTLPRLSPLANLLTGAVARASAGLVLMPVTVIKVRYESNLYAYRSLWDAGTGILRSEGPRGFFAGLGATALRDAPYAGLYVLFYESWKLRLSALVLGGTTAERSARTRRTRMPAASINFASGVMAAGLATALTNPFDAVKTRLQLMPGRYVNMVQAARTMVRQEGVRSLFDGLALRMARKAMSSALAWTLYEELIRRAETKWEDGSGRMDQ